MKTIRILSALSTLIMGGMIVYSLVVGDFFGEGSILMSLVWGQMSLVDLYVGFILVYAWIFYREQNWIARVLWFIAMMVFGNLTFAVYLFLESMKANSVETLLLKKK
jgi:hypothetical protein